MTVEYKRNKTNNKTEVRSNQYKNEHFQTAHK